MSSSIAPEPSPHDYKEDLGPQERFRLRRGSVERLVTRRDSTRVKSHMARVPSPNEGPTSADEAEKWALRVGESPLTEATGPELRTADLFSGFGGLTVGLAEAARAVGSTLKPVLAVDFEKTAIDAYNANFPSAKAIYDDVLNIFPGEVGTSLTSGERELSRSYGDLDVLVGGPPCQGHSALNNRTRHNDSKNRLYRTMVRAAEVLRPHHIMIENVPGALRDRESVVQRTADELIERGYNVTLEVIDLSRIGVPQKRKRLILLASLDSSLDAAIIEKRHARQVRGVEWAIGDLADASSTSAARLIDQVARSAPDTRRRIDYLFDNGLHELPDQERPPCHASGGHSYTSIYGRLAADKPSQTITTGFYSMCMGRYVHPDQRRTLTAHEAARLQYIPDWFSFDTVPGRTALAKMIGNAVPPRLSFAVGVEMFR